jgi:hypothetical protein
MRKIILTLLANFLISWMILPLLIPPIRIYSFGELIEVLFWQSIGLLGWPLAIPGAVYNLLYQFERTDFFTFLYLLSYPSMWFLLIWVWRSQRLQMLALVGLHLLLIISFGAVWFQVLNGYDFMVG